ncbi:MAG: hypothetical protein WC782_13935 [Methylococcaceae bacterium]|jgi:hypothetical protein
MLNKFLTVYSSLLVVLTLNAQANENTCIAIGGTFLAESIDENNRLLAATGNFTSAHVLVIEKKKTETGLNLSTQHMFVDGKGGVIKTQDSLVLTAVPGKDQAYMVEATYNVVESKGTFAGYKGQFNSFGLAKLGEIKAILHYSGRLCQ